MSVVETICKKLGVELNEEWQGNDGHTYKIVEDGRLFVKDYDWLDVDDWANIVAGHLKPVWKPKFKELYYIPCISSLEGDRYDSHVWKGDSVDNWYYDMQLIFKTPEEAKDCTNRMLVEHKEQHISN